jgi:hypothetical protein
MARKLRLVCHARLEIAPGEPGSERTGGGRVVVAQVKGSPERVQAASRRKIES